jgi:hypothetical protein
VATNCKGTSYNKDIIEKSVIETLKAKGQRTVVDLSVLMKIDKMELLEKISLMELEGKIILHGAVAKLPVKGAIKA